MWKTITYYKPRCFYLIEQYKQQLIIFAVMPQLSFELISTDNNSKARAGKITTDHGNIETPIFMPVGTVGSVKAVTQQQLKAEINAQIILGNTYHLYLRPGTDVLEAAGGLHQFNGWDRPILTDSGGYQVFLWQPTEKLPKKGCCFKAILMAVNIYLHRKE